MRKRREISIDSLGVSLYDIALALVLLGPKYLEERTEQGKDSFGFTLLRGSHPWLFGLVHWYKTSW